MILAIGCKGPDLSESEMTVTAKEHQDTLDLKQAQAPGNYTLLDAKNNLLAGFSLNVRTEESQLDRVPVEEIERALGEGVVVPVGRTVSLKEAAQGPVVAAARSVTLAHAAGGARADGRELPGESVLSPRARRG